MTKPTNWMEECADFWNRYIYINEMAQERCEEQAKMWIEKLRDAQPQPEPANEFNPDWDELEACRECLREYMAEIKKLKKEWVGLTEDEATILFRLCLGRPYDDFYRAIEAKLKEKNAND